MFFGMYEWCCCEEPPTLTQTNDTDRQSSSVRGRTMPASGSCGAAAHTKMRSSSPPDITQATGGADPVERGRVSSSRARGPVPVPPAPPVNLLVDIDTPCSSPHLRVDALGDFRLPPPPSRAASSAPPLDYLAVFLRYADTEQRLSVLQTAAVNIDIPLHQHQDFVTMQGPTLSPVACRNRRNPTAAGNYRISLVAEQGGCCSAAAACVQTSDVPGAASCLVMLDMGPVANRKLWGEVRAQRA